MVSALISRFIVIVFGTLYPAYASYKTIKSKNPNDYVRWMMYWTVFAVFLCAETLSDLFLSWFPFYYEIKIVFVLWLLLPATNGAKNLYKYLHRSLEKHEETIDTNLQRVSDEGYSALFTLGSTGFTWAAQTFAQVAVVAHKKFGEQLKNNYGNDIDTVDATTGSTRLSQQDSVNIDHDRLPKQTVNQNVNQKISADDELMDNSDSFDDEEEEKYREDIDNMDSAYTERRVLRRSSRKKNNISHSTSSSSNTSSIEENIVRRRKRRAKTGGAIEAYKSLEHSAMSQINEV